MENIKKNSIAQTFNAKLSKRWVWLVLVLTVGLTALFYCSQKPQVLIYTQHIKSLSDYQLLESKMMVSMERLRQGGSEDSLLIQAMSMTLREMAVSFSREMDDNKIHGMLTPPSAQIKQFERHVLGKLSGMRRYAVARNKWMEEWRSVEQRVVGLPQEVAVPMLLLLDSARTGKPVSRSSELVVPDSFALAVDSLLARNNDLALMWSHFDNSTSLSISSELILFFQRESMDEMALKSKIPMVFYFLSLVLLLSTFFFLFKSRL